MDNREIIELQNKIKYFAEEIENYKKEYRELANEELQKTKEYTLEEAKLALEYKTGKNPYNIAKPTKDDLDRMIRIALEKVFLDMELAKKRKEIVEKQYKMTEIQISALQSMLSYQKQLMNLT